MICLIQENVQLANIKVFQPLKHMSEINQSIETKLQYLCKCAFAFL